MKKLIVGNWKMNMDRASCLDLIANTMETVNDNAEVVICPPHIYIEATLEQVSGSHISLGAQDCSEYENGAHTGDISAAMLSDMGCKYVILGHSERRDYHGESCTDIAAKTTIAQKEGLKTIICVGEVEETRAAGNTEAFIAQQLDHSIPKNADSKLTIVAYEPIWAIGTGNTPTDEEIEETLSFIKEKTGKKFPVLYGGSVKPSNAKALADISVLDGFLIGGSSIKADEFIAIIESV